MPHFEIKVYPGYTPEQLDALTKSVVQAAVRDLQVPARVVSVAIETVPPEQWEKRVYEPLIQDRPELKKAPEY